MDPLRCLACIDLSHRPYHLAASPSGRVIVASSQEGAIALLSPSLGVLGSLDRGAKVDGIAVSPDGEHLGLSLRDRTCVLTARGEVVTEVRHDPWLDWAGGGCTFSPDGRYFWAVRPGGDERAVRVEVTGCDSWQVVATEEFEAEEDGDWFLVPHPEGGVVGLWLGAGQDGQWLYWCGIEDDGFYVEEEPALAGTGPPVFHPAGGEYLTDDLDDGLLRRHRFPSGEVMGRLSETAAFPSEDVEDQPDKFGGLCEYVSEDRAVVLSSNYGLYLLDLRAMRIEGELPLEGSPLELHRFDWHRRERRYGDVEQFRRLDGRRLLTVHRNWIEQPVNPDYRLKVWDATPLGQGIKGPDGDRPFTAAYFSHFLR